MCAHNDQVGLKLSNVINNTGGYIGDADVMNVPIDFYVVWKGVFCQILKIRFGFFRMDQMSFVMDYFGCFLLNNVQEGDWRV